MRLISSEERPAVGPADVAVQASELGRIPKRKLNRAFGVAVLAAAMTANVLPRGSDAAAAEPDISELAVVERMANLFATRLAASGGYVWAYSPDLAVRRGEGGSVEEGVLWNQPPGTPAVGAAFLRLYEITRNPRWLEAAGAAAQATLEGQLLSGGWYNSMETQPASRANWCYRSTVANEEQCKQIEGNKKRNDSTFDDNITQSSFGFLLWYDRASTGHNPAVAEAINYGLDRLLASQYPNGAWPTGINRGYPHRLFSAAWRAQLPASTPQSWVKPPDAPLVLNDNLMRDVMRLLLAADRYLERDDLLPAARRTGEFLLAAQLPFPQRGWAQMYNLDLEPIWGRKFEPPAVASRETAGAIDALLQLYLRTDDKRYLDGAIEAAEWLRKSRRPSGDWARFYELGSNRPLFVAADGRLTHDESNLHEGYGFVADFGIRSTLDLLDRVVAGDRPEIFDSEDWIFEPRPYGGTELPVRLDRVDDEGRLVEEGWIRSGTFVEAVLSLGRPAGGDVQ